MYDFGPQITNAQHMISKHNHVRDAIFKAAVEAGLGPIREPDGLLPGWQVASCKLTPNLRPPEIDGDPD